MSPKKSPRPEKRGREGKQSVECPHCHEKVGLEEIEEKDGNCSSCDERVLPEGYNYANFSEDDLITELEDEAFEEEEEDDEEFEDEDDDAEEDEEDEEEEEEEEEEEFEEKEEEEAGDDDDDVDDLDDDIGGGDDD